jgi:hypothetical protein
MVEVEGEEHAKRLTLLGLGWPSVTWKETPQVQALLSFDVSFAEVPKEQIVLDRVFMRD